MVWRELLTMYLEKMKENNEVEEREKQEHLARHLEGRNITGVSYVVYRSQLSDGRRYTGKKGHWKVYWQYFDGCFGGSFHISRYEVLYYKILKKLRVDI